MPLIPLIYARYHYPKSWKNAIDIDQYLLRALLSGAFGTYADALIDQSIDVIKEQKGFSTSALLNAIRSKGKSTEIAEEKFWKMGYGSELIHVIFSLWYRGFNYIPSFEGNLPQVDHIFPKSKLSKVKHDDPVTGKKGMRYLAPERDQLANCMLLTAQENGAGGKSDVTPDIWFADKDEAYLSLHSIPSDPKLWQMEAYSAFIEERKKLLRQRFRDILASVANHDMLTS